MEITILTKLRRIKSKSNSKNNGRNNTQKSKNRAKKLNCWTKLRKMGENTTIINGQKFTRKRPSDIKIENEKKRTLVLK